MSIYTTALTVRWRTPKELHTDTHPFCGDLNCACHFDEENIDLLVELIERQELSSRVFGAIYCGELPMPVKVEVLL